MAGELLRPTPGNGSWSLSWRLRWGVKFGVNSAFECAAVLRHVCGVGLIACTSCVTPQLRRCQGDKILSFYYMWLVLVCFRRVLHCV